jgi:hypothetical protein
VELLPDEEGEEFEDGKQELSEEEGDDGEDD